MPTGREDDAASGIFTYDGSFASSAQNTQVTSDASFAAKVAAENERVAAEYELPLGLYGFGGVDGETPSVTGSQPTDDVASAYSGVFDMDESSFLRGVSADAAFEAQERAEEFERSRSTPPGSKSEETRGTVGDFIGDYDVPKTLPSDGEGSRTSHEGGFLDGLVRTMVSMGLAWGTPGRPATPETADKTNSPTGSHEDGGSGVASVSILSFDGPEAKVAEVNSTASASRAPLFKGRAVARSYPERSTTQQSQTKPPLLNPARLISICSCVVLLAAPAESLRLFQPRDSPGLGQEAARTLPLRR